MIAPGSRLHPSFFLRQFRQPAFGILAGLILILLLSGMFCPPLVAATAKSQYLDADTCLKKLRRSSKEGQKVSSWLSCINRYESIYTTYPEDSWAPAGMYKAAELYIQLHDLSHDPIYRDRGNDLLSRLKNKYPQSAYCRRAETLEEKLKSSGKTDVKMLKSMKEQTRNDAAIDEYKKRQEDNTVEEEAPLPPALPGGDTRITDLRFWSNPEYTRIVINADAERAYAHHLLKKDPTINQPFQRLFVDIDKARLAKNVATHTPINDDLLSQARAGQYQTHTVRVVVDIKSFENYKVFSLKDPFRIVIDVWGKGGGKNAGMVADSEPGMAPPSPQTEPIKTDRVTTDNLKSSDIARQLALGVRKIVIDPGHGGKDPGAPGYVKGVWEKDIVLKLAKQLADTLRKRLNCEVLITRDKDTYLTLEERTAIANTKRADLFISLHCNAAKNKTLSGIETYILNLATDDQAIAVAARENATSRKNISDLEYILSDLMKHAKIEESSRLATDVQNALVKGLEQNHSDIVDHGVKQAPFYVLLGARMPSILVETSFISNKQECKRLMTSSYRDDICNAITDGVEKYINATNPKHL